MHEHDGAVIRSRRKDVLHPLVIQPIAVHGWKQANASQSLFIKRAGEPGGDVTGRGVEHEKADEPRQVSRDGGCDRFLVAWNARDDRSPCDAMPVELGDPPIGQLGGAAGILPAKAMRYCGRPVGGREGSHACGQQLQKPAREEMAMRVAQSHDEKAIIIGLVSDTHGIVHDSLFEALAGVSRILHAGDVGGRSVLDALATIAPVQAVCGNVDPIDGRLPDELALVAGGLSIHVSHGHELGSPTPAKLLSSYSADILIYGHTHKALVERDGLRLVINPGAAGPRRFDLLPSVARLTIAGGRADVRLVTLGG